MHQNETTTDAGMSPAPFADLIATAAAAAEPMPPSLDAMSKRERMKHHQSMLRHIGFYKGLDGVKEYWHKYPESVAIRVNLEAIAYAPKPAGYDARLVGLAELWLTSNLAVAETNVADVERLNASLGTHFPPSKHFSERVSKGRLAKIKAVFERHGASLDTMQAYTMSKVKEAARAARGNMDPDRMPFGSIGFVVGNNLVVNGRTYPIELNGERQCIRPTIDGRRPRLYLNEFEWIADWLLAGRDDPLSTTTVRSIGELPYSLEMGENEADVSPEISGLPYGKRVTGLRERLAALRPLCQPQSATYDEDDDPLNHLPLHD